MPKRCLETALLVGTEVMGRLLADMPVMREDHRRVMEVSESLVIDPNPWHLRPVTLHLGTCNIPP